MTGLVFATEDELSEAVGLSLAAEAGLYVGQLLRRGGFGYLKSKVGSFCEIALRQPVLLLTDLDRVTCAPTLLNKWMGASERPENFIFRVVVREIESWLLADHHAMRSLIGARIGKLPPEPDHLMVRLHWQPARAADRSASLAKTRLRLRELAERIR